MTQAATAPLLIDVRAVAELLGVSSRHILRLAEAGKMPPARKLGHLRRWSKSEIDEWVSAGCPAVRHVSAGH